MHSPSEPEIPAGEGRPPVKAQGLPVLGNLPSMMADPLKTLARIAHRYRGAVVNVPLGPIQLIMPTTPGQVAHMFYDHWRKYPEWLADRRLLQPMFSHRNIDNITVEMIASLTDAFDAFAPRAARGALAINREFKTLTMNTLTRCLFGVSLTHDEAGKLGPLAVEVFDAMLRRMFLFFLPSVLPLPSELALRRALRKLDDILLEHLRRRRDEAEPRNDLISLLLHTRDEETGEPLPLRQIRDELVTFFFAGHETTTMTLGWALYLLGRNPRVLEKVTAEIDSVLGGETPTVEKVAELRYTLQVIQETLRIYPPAWIIPRTCSGDVIDGYAIPPGSVVAVNTYAIHHDPELWERPESFEPERFEESASWPRGLYVPFGGGPRVCIGERFSLVEAQLILAMFLQRFRPRLENDAEIPMRGLGAALKPARDIMMVCSPRN
jgi:cytochrome P450